jgi:mannose-6-phosphate isomerase-like protein (cupin superfamily)
MNNKVIFYENIEKNTITNNNYRKVVYTGKMQFVYMSLKPLDDIHMEIHKEHDQFFRIEAGKGEAIINGQKYDLEDGIGFIISAGTPHQIINTSIDKDLKLYSIYCPPEHPPNRLDVNNPEKNLESKYTKYKNKYLKLKNLLNN